MSESIFGRELLSEKETAKIDAIKELADTYLALFDEPRRIIELDLVADFVVDIIRLNDGAVRIGETVEAMQPEISFRKKIEAGMPQLLVSKDIGVISRTYYPQSSHDIDLASRLLEIASELSLFERTVAYSETEYSVTNSFNKYGKLVERYDYSEDV